MSLVRHIVVGTDFGPEAKHAIAYAGDLALALGATLTVLHVDEKLAFVPGSDLARQEQRADEEALGGALQALRDRGVSAQGIVCGGVPADGICETARREQADLVVVGTRGINCLASVLLGNVAEKVIRNAPCPVVTVRDAVSLRRVEVPATARVEPTHVRSA